MIGPKTTLILQRQTTDYSAKTQSWGDVREITGVLKLLSGREQNVFNQLQLKADYSFLCDIQKGITITGNYRFRHEGIYYLIKRVVDNKTYLAILLETGTGKNVG